MEEKHVEEAKKWIQRCRKVYCADKLKETAREVAGLKDIIEFAKREEAGISVSSLFLCDKR